MPTEKGAKIPQRSSPRYGSFSADAQYRKLLKIGTLKLRVKSSPCVHVCAGIQLAGIFLANYHTFKLLSDPLKRTLYI